MTIALADQGHLQVGTSALCFLVAAAAAVITHLKAKPKVARRFISDANLMNQLIKRQMKVRCTPE